MYRTKAIILYRQAIRDNQIRTILFSEDYGKITAWEKNTSIWDIWNIVEILLERKNSQNLIKKISLIHSMNTDLWKYDEVIEYLNTLQILYHTLPEWVEQRSLYKDIIFIINSVSLVVWKVWILLLSQARILSKMWYLQENNKLTIEWNLLTEIIKSISMESMFYKKILADTDISILHTLILKSKHQYLYNT